MFNSKVFKALEFAAVAHVNQSRKFNGHPYIVHPIDVVSKLNDLLQEDVVSLPTSLKTDMLCAAALHDVIEDTSYSYNDITSQFGDRVAYIVESLTNTSKSIEGLDRAGRKAYDKESMMGKPIEVQMIKYCDIMSNTKDILVESPDFAKKYLAEKLDYMSSLSNLPDELQVRLAVHLTIKMEAVNNAIQNS